jgi:uncharacterized Zn finger protein
MSDEKTITAPNATCPECRLIFDHEALTEPDGDGWAKMRCGDCGATFEARVVREADADDDSDRNLSEYELLNSERAAIERADAIAGACPELRVRWERCE